MIKNTCGLNMNNNIVSLDKNRPPIICVAGHIDHGKTTLLQCISGVQNPQKEYGGITQHIKSYYINTEYGVMTFLDTPGHFAFNSNRENCIKISDIVLIVISLEDGIKPQTLESIILAKKFNVPIIIGLNKSDKIDNLLEKSDKILNDLMAHDIVAEKWGGDTLVVSFSAKTMHGIDNLLSTLKLQSDMVDLKIYNKTTCGIILENRMDVNKGYVTTLILKDGILSKGQIVNIADNLYKIKNIFTVENKPINIVTPSLPVNIIGINTNVEIGDNFIVVPEYKKVKKRIIGVSNKNNDALASYNVENVLEEMKKMNNKKINIILKVDVQGSLKVVRDVLENLSTESIKIVLVKCDVGTFNESDVELSKIVNGLMLGFNISIDNKIKKLCAAENIVIHLFNVIYDVLDFMKEQVESEKIVDKKPELIGIADVKKVFNHKDIVIAGCIVTSGKIRVLSNVKVLRNNNLIYEGTIESIKVFKNEVKEVKAKNECGVIIKKYNKLQMNDILEIY